MWYTYILQSQKDGKYYTGHASNLENRIARHNSGRNKSTRCRAPFLLVFSETYSTRSEAFSREMQIKSFKGGEAFKKIIMSSN